VEELEQYLAPAPGVSCDEPELWDLARSIVRGSKNDVEAGVQLFNWVRDTVRYSAYVPFWDLRHYHAATIMARGCGYCVQKSALLVALYRSLGFPARLSFADIENHLLGQNLAQYLGTKVMTFHCFAELFLGGKWVKATPSFEQKLCQAQGWKLVEFNGRENAMLPAEDLQGRPHVAYLKSHFSSPGVPLNRIMEAWETVYGPERMADWRRNLEKNWPKEVY
jgi:transglutaminase-like putative cysteine protease